MEEKRETNGNKFIRRWLFLWVLGGVFAVIGLLASYVVANDVRQTNENEEIRKEVVAADTDLRKEVQSELKEIRKEQTAMRKEQSDMKTDILVAIKGLEAKIEK